jgi:hypothetical protein
MGQGRARAERRATVDCCSWRCCLSEKVAIFRTNGPLAQTSIALCCKVLRKEWLRRRDCNHAFAGCNSQANRLPTHPGKCRDLAKVYPSYELQRYACRQPAFLLAFCPKKLQYFGQMNHLFPPYDHAKQSNTE